MCEGVSLRVSTSPCFPDPELFTAGKAGKQCRYRKIEGDRTDQRPVPGSFVREVKAIGPADIIAQGSVRDGTSFGFSRGSGSKNTVGKIRPGYRYSGGYHIIL